LGNSLADKGMIIANDDADFHSVEG
jgi:hypothetical protein